MKTALDDLAPLDCVIVGAGPAGLTAALYLARFRRSFALLDEGESRARCIPTSHNIPFFSDGISGREILARQRHHLTRYGVTPSGGTVLSAEKHFGNFEVKVRLDGAEMRRLRCRTLLLATGAVDVAPRLPSLHYAIERGLLRYCPVCDGYEAAGKRIAVIGSDTHGLNEAIFIARTYSHDVTLLTLRRAMKVETNRSRQIDEHGIKVMHEPTLSVSMDGGQIAAVCLGGSEQRFEVLYSALGLKPRSGLAVKLGAARDGSGAIITDEHGQTSSKGVYAAGGVTRGLDQVVVAMGQAAIAATDIHNQCALL